MDFDAKVVKFHTTVKPQPIHIPQKMLMIESEDRVSLLGKTGDIYIYFRDIDNR